MSGDHKENAEPPPRFCAERIHGKCTPHENNYQTHETPDWEKFPQRYRIFEKDPVSEKRILLGTGIRYMGHNAHHILCAASIGKFIVETEIRPAVDKTDWCVNKEKNIKALPLWGQWFKYYVNQLSGDLLNDPEPGPDTFIDRPMHNSDHHKYQKNELDLELQDIAKKIKKNNKAHEDSAKDLADALDELIKKFSSDLDDRGIREDGTHKAWVKALNNSKYKDWYKPFSMASDPTPREFPIHKTGDIRQKISHWLAAVGEASLSP